MEINNEKSKQTLKIRHVTNLWRNLPREIIHIKIQVTELGQPGNPLWYFPTQSIEVQVQPSQALEGSQGFRYCTRESLPLQRDIGHKALLVASHAFKRATAWISVCGPWSQELVLWVQRGLYSHESGKLSEWGKGRRGKEEEKEETKVEAGRKRHLCFELKWRKSVRLCGKVWKFFVAKWERTYKNFFYCENVGDFSSLALSGYVGF